MSEQRLLDFMRLLDFIDVIHRLEDNVQNFSALVDVLDRRLTAIETELAVMRGTQSASRWSGDSPPMTIDTPTRD